MESRRTFYLQCSISTRTIICGQGYVPSVRERERGTWAGVRIIFFVFISRPCLSYLNNTRRRIPISSGPFLLCKPVLSAFECVSQKSPSPVRVSFLLFLPISCPENCSQSKQKKQMATRPYLGWDVPRGSPGGGADPTSFVFHPIQISIHSTSRPSRNYSNPLPSRQKQISSTRQ